MKIIDDRRLRAEERDQRFQQRMIVVILFSVFCLLFSGVAVTDARVYIDITSPAFKELPVAIYDFTGSAEGGMLAEVIRDDLQFSGVFYYVDSEAYIEPPNPSFDPQNWLPLGVELVVKGSVEIKDDNMMVATYIYDVVEGRRTEKRFSTERSNVRPLGHAIADYIYRHLTGEAGAFRSKIVFIAERGEKRGIYRMDWDGARLRYMGISERLLFSPHWSTDGKELLFSFVKGKKWQIASTNFKRIKRHVSSSGTNIAGEFLPGSKDFLFSSSMQGTPDIYHYQSESAKIKRITSGRGIEVSPAVSPDGRRVAFVSNRGGSPQVYTMRMDGTDLRRVTFSGGYNTSPVWSPDGRKILYSGRVYGRHQIFIVNPDGSNPVQLTGTGSNEEPVFAPNGRYIAFVSDRKGKKAVFIMRSNGTGQRRITPPAMKAFGPAWSPE